MSCYNAASCEMVFPGRGKIAVDAKSVKRIWNLPNKGRPVPYVADQDANNTIKEMYGLENGNSPQLPTWVDMIKAMNGTADHKIFRAWLIVAISGFLRPSTSTKVSPTSFPAVVDLKNLLDLDFYQFVADSIQYMFLDLGDKKNSGSCCVFHLVLLYLDSLVHGERISGCEMQVQAWTPNLIKKVIKKDTKEDGQFGKLPLKDVYAEVAQREERNVLFGGAEAVVQFVNSRLPMNTNANASNTFKHTSPAFFFVSSAATPYLVCSNSWWH